MGVFTVGRQVALEIDMPGWWLANASVDMDFRRGFYYDLSIANPRAATNFLSCSRASIGYAKNTDGTLTQFANDTLRIGVGTGLLVEDLRTNNHPDSQDFTGGNWFNFGGNTVTANTAVAPDGTSTADSLVANASSSGHELGGDVGAVGDGVVWTFSCYFKAAGYNFGKIRAVTSGGAVIFEAIYDLTNATVANTQSTGSPTGTGSGAEQLANGWVRGWLTMTAIISSAVDMRVAVSSSSSFSSWIGDGSNGIYLWGGQMEPGAFPSSYIPTTTTAATRAADNVTTSGSLQTVINAAIGSLVAQADNGEVTSTAANIVDSNGTNLLGFDATNHGLASITATLATSNTASRTTQDKLGLAWSGAGRSLVLNNGTVATDASAQTPSATQHIGSNGSANFAYAYIERLTAWTSKLADATLQALTAP